MTERQLTYFDIVQAKKAYAEGKNITELLRTQKNVTQNTPEIIETAYDLQAGSYIDSILKNPRQTNLYSAELAEILDRNIKETDALLDIGSGELTTLSQVICKLKTTPQVVYAFDISWSRIYKGMAYAQDLMGNKYKLIRPFVADISAIPLLDKSINVTTSSHALEPNGGALSALMGELFRITIDKLVLFEPCFEINTEAGKQRMDRLGYIKNIEGIVEQLGGKLLDRITIKHPSNPLNPTACFIIAPPFSAAEPARQHSTANDVFSVPGTNLPLRKVDDFYFSKHTGLCYPTLKKIPILKSNAAILASSLEE